MPGTNKGKYMSVHKIEVRNREGGEGKLTTGALTQVLLDGQPLRGVTFFKFEVKPSKIAKVQIEMVAEVGVDINTELNLSEPKPTEFIVDDQPMELYTLSSYYPTDTKKDKHLEIKAALLQGGIVYAERASGKSRAIAEILKDDINTVVICDNVAQKGAIQRYALGVAKTRIKLNNPKSLSDIPPGSKIFIDEYNPRQYSYPPFFAAATSCVSIV
jgi:hypothetical protein